VNAPGQPLLATGWSLHLPGVPVGATIAEHVGQPRGGWAREAAVPADQAATLLGRRGLLHKEPATRLALCAVHRALGLAPGQRPDWPVTSDTAVIVASNLGNVETVARVARTVAAEGGVAVSVLDAPNVSSNVVASVVALRFGFGGPNVMVCSGAGAGLDALALAGLLLRAQRAERVVLVGVEPADEVAAALHGAGTPAYPLRAGAACLVLEAWRSHGSGRARVELVPSGGPWPRPVRVLVGRGGFDPVPLWGSCYGAQGVVGLALAAHLAVDEAHRVVGVRDDGEDGWRTALVSSVECGARSL